jgi:RNA polymerase sigma-70 factor (ECF subfamily)
MTAAPSQAGVGPRAALAAEPRAGSGASDTESRRWLADLRATGPRHEEAVARLHALLLRAARVEGARRRASLAGCGAVELEEIALESADDALVALLARLERYRGLSRFTTWAYKFALLEAAVKIRRRAWRERELPLAHDAWEGMAAADPSPQRRAESAHLLQAVKAGMDEALTAHQREVLSALALGGVPIDVLAERLGTTRGALYKTLHDARHRLREHLERTGWDGIPATSGRTGA